MARIGRVLVVLETIAALVIVVAAALRSAAWLHTRRHRF
jgi:hypothetical protein